MRTALLVGMLPLAATATIAVTPTAEARQFCTYGQSDPCDEYVVCVWDHANGAWLCKGRVDPCWFRCW